MDKPVIYITRKLPSRLLEKHQDSFTFKMWQEEEEPVSREVLKKEVKQADGLLSMLSDAIDEEVLAEAENLKVVANLAVGYDNIDLQAARQHRVTVTNTPDVLTETTADLTFSLLLATARRIVEAAEFVKADKWKNWSPFLMAGTDVYRKKIGIIGMGRIGEAVARRAAGFGMEILYHNRSRKEEAEKVLSAVYRDFDSLLEEADYVVCLAPYTKETAGMFNREAFRKMKKSAIFINASRGKNVDEEALYDALVNGDIHAAGLDVFAEEPIRNTHPLLKLDQVVCLPHIGSASQETRETMIALCLENIQLVLSGSPPKTPVG